MTLTVDKNNVLAFIMTFMLGFGTVSGASARQDSVLIHFRQSKVNLDTNYMGNRQALEQARNIIKAYDDPDSLHVLSGVTVVGGASPEGSIAINERLSRKRATKIFDYFTDRMEIPDSLTSFTYLGRDWRGLRQMVLDDHNVPYRDEVITAIDDILEHNRQGEQYTRDNLLRLKQLHGGTPYLYMYYHLFPALRESKIMLTFEVPVKRLEILQSVGIYMPAPAALPAPTPIIIDYPEVKKPFYMALKTNMLYDALAVPNISAEFYLGRDFSIVGNWMYGWWDNDHRHRYWRIYGGDLAVRWWFGEKAHVKPLTGHHVGLYGGAFTYDFEFGGRGYMGGLPGRTLWDRCNYQGGIEYGYSLPIGHRLNIDFTLGVGYIGGKYIEYIPVDRCYVWQATKRYNRFGPTKLEISLTWLIGRGNFNAKKTSAL